MKGKILTNGALRKAKRQSVELYGCPVNLYERPYKRRVLGKRIEGVASDGMPWKENPPPWKKVTTAWKKVGFHPTFSRHGIAQILSALALLIWLNEKVPTGGLFLRPAAPPKIDAT